MIPALAWLAWLVAAVLAASATRNPLYQVTLLLIFALVAEDAAAPGGERHGDDPSTVPLHPLRFALVVVPLAALFNALMARYGSTVLLRLPPALPLLSGPITAESLVYGASNGLVLATFFAAFAVLNRALPTRDLVRLIPRAFYPVAVVASIAVTFVPATLRQMRQVREAQAIRGHRMRGLRDWLPLFVPLLVGGMERALQLAEAMTARGFGAAAAPAIHESPGTASPTPQTGHRDLAVQLGTLAGLVLVLIGGLIQRPAARIALLALGGAALLGALWRAGSHTRHTVYRRAAWTPSAWMVALGAAAALAGFLGLGQASRAYVPYPTLTLPPFEPLAGLSLLGFLLPLAAPAEGEPGERGDDDRR